MSLCGDGRLERRQCALATTTRCPTQVNLRTLCAVAVFSLNMAVEIVRGIAYWLPARYQGVEYIGGGTFGQVVGAHDTRTNSGAAKM